jgi:hypothetical protein
MGVSTARRGAGCRGAPSPNRFSVIDPLLAVGRGWRFDRGRIKYTLNGCMADFIWDDANAEHATRHGVSIEEIEYVVRRARSPWPMSQGDDKFVVWGRTAAGD